jgi:Ca2+-binding RTX toxin-like protein
MMTTTPTVWKSQFTVFAGTSDGSLREPLTIGLAGGGFLTAWTDSTDPLAAGEDVFGRMYDAEGNAVATAFQLNQRYTSGDEDQPAIAATPDGGFFVAYQHSGIGDPISIEFDRFNAAGTRIAGGGISGGVVGTAFGSPSMATHANGDVVVSYVQTAGGDSEILSRVINSQTNTAGLPDNISSNGTVDDEYQDTTVLSNNIALTVYASSTGGGFQVSNSSGLLVTLQGTHPKVAALTGGSFVVVWETQFPGEIRARVGGGAEFLVRGGDPSMSPDVVALEDGGFFVAWSDGPTDHILGQRYNAAGTKVGSLVTIANEIAVFGLNLDMSNDGRILATFRRSNGNVAQVILDAREKTIVGDNTAETITSRLDGASVNGLGGNDLLLGQGAADTLIGGLGADTMKGRGGNDVYLVDHAGDIVDETGGAGIDRVSSTVTFSLANPARAIGLVENLTLAGTAAIAGIGNGLNNVITGNAAANVLDGGAGNDVLRGLAGNDTLRGLVGNDTYILENGADVVVDTGGVDAATTTITRNMLAAGLSTVERMTVLSGNAGVAGNNLNNVITGSTGANILSGGNGNDVVNGGAGSDELAGGAEIDTLTGGANNDFFVFNAPLNIANRDVITDFSAALDTIRLENAVMTKVGPAGLLKSAAFFAGTAAHDADDRIVYNKLSGAIVYDSNGNLAGGATLLATLTTKPTLTAADFVVI